ncbi:MAG: hypothetical protein ACREXW_00940 [Gammaproteobacteria bacterium]
MPTTFHVANFVNTVIDTLTGKTSSNSTTLESSAEIYSGAQPVDPSVTPAGTLLATVTIANASWSAVSAGIAQLAAPRAGTGAATGTASFARIKNTIGNPCIDVTCGVAGSGAGCILDTLSITNGGAFEITNLSMKMPESLGTLKLNIDARNKMVAIWTDLAGALQMGISGTVSVYTGSAPATADEAPTGTKLVDLPTTATCPWNTAVGGASALGTNLTANAVASGTAGYARWTKGVFTIQGSVGTSAADFILDSLSITSGNPVSLTEATISF